MTTRIDLDALRRLAENHGVYVAGDGHNSATMADWDEVLALIEAVEAAHGLDYVVECRCDEAWTGRGLHAPWCLHEEGADLRTALGRFDFGGGA